jgi:hypothetical protein
MRESHNTHNDGCRDSADKLKDARHRLCTGASRYRETHRLFRRCDLSCVATIANFEKSLCIAFQPARRKRQNDEQFGGGPVWLFQLFRNCNNRPDTSSNHRALAVNEISSLDFFHSKLFSRTSDAKPIWDRSFATDVKFKKIALNDKVKRHLTVISLLLDLL